MLVELFIFNKCLLAELFVFVTIQMSSSSETERDGSESKEDDLFNMRVMELLRQYQMNISLTACFVNNYYSTYHDKNGCISLLPIA